MIFETKIPQASLIVVQMEIVKLHVLNHNHFCDCKLSVLLWTSNDNDTNGHVGLELPATSNEFNISVMNGLFSHLYNAPDVTNEIVFMDNMFVNFNDSGASDYMMKMNITLVNNEWDNLVASQFIGTKGPVCMFHMNMNLFDNSNYLVSKNPSVIDISDLTFNIFDHCLVIDRNEFGIEWPASK